MAINRPGSCGICRREDARHDDLEPRVTRCLACGTFQWDREALEDLAAVREDLRYILSGVARERAVMRWEPIHITKENLASLASEARLPPTMGERWERIGRFLESKVTGFADPVSINIRDDRSVAFAKTDRDFLAVLGALVEHGWIQTLGQPDNTDGNKKTTVFRNDGWTWLDEIRRARPKSGNLCFVAMQFEPGFTAANWSPGFEAGCADAHYRAIRLDKDPHNGIWMDWIMARIRESRFVVADLSENRGGVYMEAGFALGLGTPLILTCRQDRFVEEGLVHSDAKQFTIIRWTDPADLRKQLKDRIEGTIGKYEGPGSEG